jgi:hypothetical protein
LNCFNIWVFPGRARRIWLSDSTATLDIESSHLLMF